MNRKEYDTLVRNVRLIYPEFKGNEDLLNYKYQEVYKNFQLHSGNTVPSYEELTKDLRYENEKAVLMQCDLCKRKIPYTTWEQFEEHYRKCQKIDFIDRQAKELKGEGIDKEHFRELTDTELDSKYRKWMDNWKSTHSVNTILKTL